MKKRAVCILCFFFIFLLIVGCTNKDVASEDFESDICKLENKILELEQNIEKQQLIIEGQEEKITFKGIQIETLEESFRILNNNFHAMNELTNLTFDSQTAILNNAVI